MHAGVQASLHVRVQAGTHQPYPLYPDPCVQPALSLTLCVRVQGNLAILEWQTYDAGKTRRSIASVALPLLDVAILVAEISPLKVKIPRTQSESSLPSPPQSSGAMRQQWPYGHTRPGPYPHEFQLPDHHRVYLAQTYGLPAPNAAAERARRQLRASLKRAATISKQETRYALLPARAASMENSFGEDGRVAVVACKFACEQSIATWLCCGSAMPVFVLWK